MVARQPISPQELDMWMHGVHEDVGGGRAFFLSHVLFHVMGSTLQCGGRGSPAGFEAVRVGRTPSDTGRETR